MRALRWLCPAAADRGIGKNPKGGTHTQISPPSTPLVHLCELQPTGCVVGTFGGGKRPVHPSLPQAGQTSHLLLARLPSKMTGPKITGNRHSATGPHASSLVS